MIGKEDEALMQNLLEHIFKVCDYLEYYKITDPVQKEYYLLEILENFFKLTSKSLKNNSERFEKFNLLLKKINEVYPNLDLKFIMDEKEFDLITIKIKK